MSYPFGSMNEIAGIISEQHLLDKKIVVFNNFPGYHRTLRTLPSLSTAHTFFSFQIEFLGLPLNSL